MGYFKLGDDVFVVGKIVKISETKDGLSYELQFEGGKGGYFDKVTLERGHLVEKKGAEYVPSDSQVN